MRWVLGDVQGCARELDDLIKWVRLDPERDELWCLGDLVNRGPDSVAALRLWHDTGGRGILGNHDVNALLAAAGLRKRKNDTLDDLFEAPDREELLAKMRALPVLVHLPAPAEGGPDAWIVHAGLLPGWTDLPRLAAEINDAEHDDDWLRSDAVSAATRLRFCTAEGEASRETGPPHAGIEPFRPWDDFYRGDTLVVHGHWARRGYYRTERTMGLDTGCVYGGPLTAWCQDEDRIVQVPSDQS